MPEARLHYFLILLSLSLLGVLGNYLHLPLFFGVSFIFGSIAVLIAVRVLGTAAAIAVAIVAGSYTYFIWGHPYALVIFTAEAFVVGILWQRKISSLVLADIIFWLLAGIPLVWFFYSGIMSMEQTPTLMIGLKQSVNGVANAIIATYLILLIPSKYTVHRNKKSHGKIRLNELLFTTLLGIPLIFSLVMVSFENKINKENLENVLTDQLEFYLEYIKHDEYINFDFIHKDLLRRKNKLDVVIFSESGSIIGSTIDKESDFIRNGTIEKVNEKLWLWTPQRNNLALMLWWKKAFYFVEKSFPENKKGKIYVLQNTRPIINKIQQNILTTFELLFALIILGGIAAYSISRSLTGTIIRLTAATKNLPEKLKSHSEIDWPRSNITEFSQLSKQAKIMSDNIASTFDEVNMQAKTILESSIDSIITVDENGIILSFNYAAEKLFGYSREEVLGSDFKYLFPEQDEESYNKNINRFDIEKFLPLSGKRAELIGCHKDGKLLPVELSVTKTEFNHNVRYTSIISDITERKVNEQLKRDFISTVSHELRTPLTSINGSIKLIQAQHDRLSSDESSVLLDAASRNVDRLTLLINDLLDFEKLDSSGFDYEKKNIHVQSLMTEVIEQTSSLAAQARVLLNENIEGDCEFISDPQRVSQILVNFISNAIKFSAEKEVVEVSCVCDDETVTFSVKDNGIGIPEQFKAQIFERFTQADSADNRQVQRGTGLGLAISKRMADDMGGTIGFDSMEGQGSTFYVIFPKLPT